MLLLFTFCYSFVKPISRFTFAERVMILFLGVAADVIVVMEVTGLLGALNQSGWIVVAQAALTAGGLWINRHLKLGFPVFSFQILRLNLKAFWGFLKTHRILSIFAFFVALNTAFLAFCIVKFPQNIADNLYNHLSRIGYWIQNGSLEHYAGFNVVGMTYPYNNSLLIALPMVILRTDVLAGFVQFTAGLLACMAVYNLSRRVGFNKTGSLWAALLLLTYPIILYESITSQNDLLAAALITSAFSLLASYALTKEKTLLVFSLLALALALGTNQYTLGILPAYAILFLVVLIRHKTMSVRNIASAALVFVGFFMLAGAYSYAQNWILLGNPFGPKEIANQITGLNNGGSIPERVAVNSARLFAQFISCDGLPPAAADFCLSAKHTILTPLLTSKVSTDLYLYTEAPFVIVKPNVYNAESAWYGPLSWILILPSIVYVFVTGVKKKEPLRIALMLSSLSFFVFIQLGKSGWDPYQGRYLITAIVLAQPAVAWIFESRQKTGVVVSALAGLAGLLIMLYATFNNASLPLVGQARLSLVEQWGQKHSELVQKVAYKLKPLLMADRDAWMLSREELMTNSDRSYLPALDMVNIHVPDNATLGIVHDFRLTPDFIFRGRQVRRVLERVPDPALAITDYLLISADHAVSDLKDYELIETLEGWSMFVKK